jgi:hypothetical protein
VAIRGGAGRIRGPVRAASAANFHPLMDVAAPLCRIRMAASIGFNGRFRLHPKSAAVHSEPPRESRRHRLSRRWGHEHSEEVFPGGPGTLPAPSRTSRPALACAIGSVARVCCMVYPASGDDMQRARRLPRTTTVRIARARCTNLPALRMFHAQPLRPSPRCRGRCEDASRAGALTTANPVRYCLLCDVTGTVRFIAARTARRRRPPRQDPD